jgi:endonuclease/exonuclease/phosphatase (EEP) superfamily protein YafD
LLLPCVLLAQYRELKVMQFNIWQEGTVVPSGFEAIVDEIIKLDADVVTFSEVRNYKNTRFNDRIVKRLKEKGHHYFSFYSEDSGILSRYPITAYSTVFPLKNDQGSIYKAHINFYGTTITVYTAHLDYKHAANYLSRGYHSSNWEKLSAPVLDINSILKDNTASQRDEAIRLFIADAQHEIANKHIVILGGDFNEPSHLDWTEASRHLYERKVAVPWTLTKMLEEAGFVDTYRLKFPDAITHPGITFPAYNKDVPYKKLLWAPDSDDRDRIDYIFYYPNKRLKLKNVYLIGPDSSIERGQIVKEDTKDPLILPKGIWPTDHRAILGVFRINSKETKRR